MPAAERCKRPAGSGGRLLLALLCCSVGRPLLVAAQQDLAFSVHDISGTISSDGKYRGGVLGGDGLVYLVPWNADSIGQITPFTCPPGHSTNSSNLCHPCPAGSFSDGRGFASSCPPCPAGTYSASEGASDCTSCPKGSHSASTGVTMCTSCPAGKFSNSSGAIDWHAAPATGHLLVLQRVFLSS